MAKWDDEDGKPIQKSRLGRAMKFGGVAARVAGSFVKKRLLSSTTRQDDRFDVLTDSAMAHAKHIVSVMGEMKGAAMKVGQLISTDPDLLSKELASALTKLQRDAPPMDYASLVSQIEGAFDRPMTDIFKYFDPDPIGSASIGQVHKARLHNGQEVAVKVQYPGVADCIDSDLKNIRTLLSMGRNIINPERADALIEEARQTILSESDYQLECTNIQIFRKRFKDNPNIRIPRPYPKWTRRSVLTMEYMHGESLDASFKTMSPTEVNRVAFELLKFYIYGFHLDFQVHGDPHPGNFLLDHERRLIVLDFGCIKTFEPHTADGILRILSACWRNDLVTFENEARALGYGTPGMKWPSHAVLGPYLKIILEPLNTDSDFRLGDFEVGAKIRNYLVKHPELIKLVPPAELLIYYRVLGGLKGLISTSGAAINFHRLARSCCELRQIES